VYRVKSRHRYQPGGGFLLSPEARSSRRRVFYRDSFAEGLSHGTDAISAAGAAGSLADLFSINNCPATSITPANAVANNAVASWWTSFILRSVTKIPPIRTSIRILSSGCHTRIRLRRRWSKLTETREITPYRWVHLFGSATERTQPGTRWLLSRKTGRGKGARLWLEPEERDQQGRLARRATWVIRDGSRKVRTGCARNDREGAERALAEYIAKKYTVSRERGRHPSEILVLDVLNIYLHDKAPKHSDPSITRARILILAEFWGDKTLAEVNGTSCRQYVGYRTAQRRRAAKPDVTGNPPRMVTAAGARRELEDLRSAINYHRTEGLCSEFVGVALC
jgi:hypothetical protein